MAHALPVPWNANGHIDRIAADPHAAKVRATTRRRKEGRWTRHAVFLINLDLSRLGALQLDGMFRRETKGFDLMVRTKAALPDTIRLDLTGLRLPPPMPPWA